jgi:hypothetical protein
MLTLMPSGQSPLWFHSIPLNLTGISYLCFKWGQTLTVLDLNSDIHSMTFGTPFQVTVGNYGLPKSINLGLPSNPNTHFCCCNLLLPQLPRSIPCSKLCLPRHSCISPWHVEAFVRWWRRASIAQRESPSPFPCRTSMAAESASSPPCGFWMGDDKPLEN